MDSLNNKMVSVVVTTYNRESLLRETIISILNQTYQDFELIVVDNYSDYDFYKFIDSFKSEKIRAYQNENNGIIAKNRNFGIEKAIGKYIAFCDDDDLWLPNKLEMQVKYMESHMDIGLSGTALFFFGDGYEKEEYKNFRYLNKYQYYCKNYVTPSTVMVRNTKDLRFDEGSSLNCAEDWALWVTLYILGYKLYQLSDPLVKYRITSQNATKKNKKNRYLQSAGILRYLKKKYGRRFKNRYYLYGMFYQYKMFVWTKILFVVYIIYKSSLRPVFKR